MTGVQTQLILFWAAVGSCALGTFFYVSSFSFQKEGFIKYGTICGGIAFLPLTIALSLRWIETGHVPSIGPYEVFTVYSWGVLAFFLAGQLRKPGIQIGGTLVLPVVMLMIGIGIMSSKEMTSLPTTYYTYWLWIHMVFATLALGGVLTSAGLALIYLIKGGWESRGGTNPLLERIPNLEQLDYLCYRFTMFAFSMMGTMIASGAIWAYKSWGRYWGWDPIETWSLICWLVYGLYLHLRKSGLKGKQAAWVNFAIIALAVFAFFGAPYLYPTIHDRFVQ